MRKNTIKIKRIYDSYEKNDGFRILVDRLWPRGVKKVDAHVDLWMKDIAPSSELRTWFQHDPEKFPEFKSRYQKELKQKAEQVNAILDQLKKHSVTLLYAAKDSEHNQAIVLLQWIQRLI